MTNSADYKLPEPSTSGRVGFKVIFVLCLLFFGISVTEAVSNNLLPLTLRRLTADPRIIGLILAINPAFGFVAQPLVGIWSDRIWTPVGRRAFFLITGAPVVALCLVFVPFCQTLLLITMLVIVYQFFQDILYGSDHPLLADLVPPQQRTLVNGLLIFSAQAAAFAVLKGGMALVDRYGEHWLYWIAAGAQMVFVCGVAFFLNEKPAPRTDRPKLTPRRYIADVVHNKMLFRLATARFLESVELNAIGGFVALFAVKTLLLEPGEFGSTWSITAVIGLMFAIPIGWTVERFPKTRVLIVGFLLVIGSCFFGYNADGARGLFWAAILYGFGRLMMNVTHKAFMSEYIPKDIIGQITGATNIFYAVGRVLALVVVPWFVINENYRVIWLVSGVVCVVNILVVLSIRDIRYDQKQATTQ